MSEFKTWEQMSELEQAQATWWDLYKDVHGVRPRGVDTSHWTLAGFEAQIRALCLHLEENQALEREAAARAVVAFERQVADNIDYGATDRAAAIQWMHQAFETGGDNEYLEYRLGLPYRYISQSRI